MFEKFFFFTSFIVAALRYIFLGHCGHGNPSAVLKNGQHPKNRYHVLSFCCLGRTEWPFVAVDF
jgi:hypothetical protein